MKSRERLREKVGRDCEKCRERLREIAGRFSRGYSALSAKKIIFLKSARKVLFGVKTNSGCHSPFKNALFTERKRTTFVSLR